MINGFMIAATAIVACIYLFSKKRLYTIEHLALFQWILAVYATAFSVIGQNKAVAITDRTMPYLTLRFAELIIPMTILLYVDRWQAFRTWTGRGLAGLLCFGVLCGFEAAAAHAQYTVTVHWAWWRSSLWWGGLIAIALVSQRLFRRFLRGVTSV